MTDTIVARRYAGAMFDLSRKEGVDALTAHGQCLADLRELIAAMPKLAATFKSPTVSVAEKKGVIGAVLEKLGADQIMRNFCFLLADKGRLGQLGDIAEWYNIKLDEANGVLRGRVTTAIKLSKAKQEEIKAQLQKKCAGTMEISFHVDPEILGGMVLSVGDRVMDSSLRAQLGILRETFKRGV